MAAALPDDDDVRAALMRVDDPEAGMNIVDLGLVYAIAVGENRVDVDLTMTSAACPMSESIADAARAAVEDIVPPGTVVDVRMVWDPPWTPERMSEAARMRFGWSG